MGMQDSRSVDPPDLGVRATITRLAAVGREQWRLSSLGLGLAFSSLALLVLGGGSNIVAPDSGWPGDVVLVRTRGVASHLLTHGGVQVVRPLPPVGDGEGVRRAHRPMAATGRPRSPSP